MTTSPVVPVWVAPAVAVLHVVVERRKLPINLDFVNVVKNVLFYEKFYRYFNFIHKISR